MSPIQRSYRRRLWLPTNYQTAFPGARSISQTFRRTGRHTRRTHRPLVIGGSIRWQRSCFSSLQSSCQLQTRSIAMYSSIIGQRALLRSKLRRSRHSQSIRDYSDHNGTVELVRRQRGDRSLDEAYADSSDYIIVGAGTAGCVLANRSTLLRHWQPSGLQHTCRLRLSRFEAARS